MDIAVTRIGLPSPVRVAASDGTTVWCAASGGLRAYTASGAFLEDGDDSSLDGSAGLEVRSLAAVPGTVSATAGVPGTLTETVVVPRSFAGPAPVNPLPAGTLAATAGDRVLWLGPTGAPLAQARFEGRVVAGGGEIWAVGDGLARRLTGAGRLGRPVRLPEVDLCAAEGERLWWTSRRDTVLRGGPKDVDLGTRERGAMTVCAGSVWVSVDGGLQRVSAWSGEPRRFVATSQGPVPFLVCANGVLVGGGGHALFALTPATGAQRDIPLGANAPLALLVAAGKHVWAFPAHRAEALVISV